MCGYAEQREPGEIRRLMADVLGADWKVTPAMVSYLMEAYVYRCVSVCVCVCGGGGHLLE